jgi:hypothetical protein
MKLDGSPSEYYLSRAADIHALAEKCKDEAIKVRLKWVSEQYETLARLINAGPLNR